ncbi:glucoamylase family protein [Stackebrandtia soli]|uniref:glucoamylase family protein n=1 Tax=Stackebrandtia soli TaxID=1892856 RepID=UPI0039E7782B
MKRRSILALAAGTSAALVLPGSPARAAGTVPYDVTAFTDSQRRELVRYAADTWRSMEALADPTTGLPADNIDGDLGEDSRSAYTSPTNIGCYLWSAIVARKLGFISRQAARERIGKVLDTLASLQRHPYSGMFYNWYDPATGDMLTTWPEDGSPIYPFLSSVDNGWLAAALMVVGNDDPSLRRRANAVRKDMNFAFYYNPDALGEDFGAGQFRGGFWPEEPPGGGVLDNYVGSGPDVWFTGHHYGTHNSETRIIGYVAIALGQVPVEHYFAPARTFADNCDWSWQEMKPVGDFQNYLGIEVFEGAYQYRGLRFVPSWGGSMFEALMPDLFVPEATWGPNSWGRNHPAFVRGQIEHGLAEAGYGHWGFSPASDPHGTYREYGVDPMGLDSAGYTSDKERTTVDYGFAGCPDREPQPEPDHYGDGVVTPHAVFLALPYAPMEAMEQLTRLRADFDIYGTGGFYDAVAVRSATVARRYLALDQGMILGALGNLLGDDVIRSNFCDDRTEHRLRHAIGIEEFNIPADQ